MLFICNVAMEERCRNDVSDGDSWWCPQCKARRSIREGSIFTKYRLTLQKWMILLHNWVRQYPVTDAVEEVEVTKLMCTNGCERFAPQNLYNSLYIQLGGAGIVVQIDESLFCHKPKVNIVGLWDRIMNFIISINAASPCKTSQVWMFGMTDISHEPPSCKW